MMRQGPSEGYGRSAHDVCEPRGQAGHKGRMEKWHPGWPAQRVCLPATGELGRRAGKEGKTYEVPCLGGRGHLARGRLYLIMKGCGSGISLPSPTPTSRDGIFRSMSILLVKAKPNGDTQNHPENSMHVGSVPRAQGRGQVLTYCRPNTCLG